jgi:hypothetical protein
MSRDCAGSFRYAGGVGGRVVVSGGGVHGAPAEAEPLGVGSGFERICEVSAGVNADG